MQHAARGRLVHRRRAHIGGADLKQEVGPQMPLGVERVIDEFLCPPIRDREKRPNEIAVVVENRRMQIEDTHISLSAIRTASRARIA